MDPRLGGALAGLIALAALAGAADLARARQPVPPDQAASPGPPPAAPPGPTGAPPPIPSASPNAQPNPQPNAQPNAPGAPPVIIVPPPPQTNLAPNAPTAEKPPATEAPPTAAPKPPTPPTTPPPPPGPPPAARGPFAVLQVLDKVTAETLKFEAPIGRRVRYKTLVFTVRVCATRGADDPQPRPSAYVVIDSQALALPGRASPPAKEVFKGWMFANAPGLHPLEHPIYDAWLVACSAAAPVN